MKVFILLGWFIAYCCSANAQMRSETISRIVAKESLRSWKQSGKAGIGIGIQWVRDGENSRYLPGIDLQYAVTHHFVLGLTGQFAAPSLFKDLSGFPKFALGAMVNYYSRAPYHGFWWQTGLKEYLYQVSGTERYTAKLAALSTAGWRWRNAEHGLSFGVALGVERVFASGARFGPVVLAAAALDFEPSEVFK